MTPKKKLAHVKTCWESSAFVCTPLSIRIIFFSHKENHRETLSEPDWSTCSRDSSSRISGWQTHDILRNHKHTLPWARPGALKIKHDIRTVGIVLSDQSSIWWQLLTVYQHTAGARKQNLWLVQNRRYVKRCWRRSSVSWGCYWTFPTLLTSSMFFSLIPTERKQSQTFHHLPSLCAGCSLVTDASYLICANPKPLVNTCIQETKITIKSLWHSVCVCERKRESRKLKQKQKSPLSWRMSGNYAIFLLQVLKKTFSILYLTELQFSYDRNS